MSMQGLFAIAMHFWATSGDPLDLDGNTSFTQRVLLEEVNPRLNFRNMLSAHTTNRPGAPLWPNNSLEKCFNVVDVDG